MPVLCQMAINELRQETGNESLQFIAVRLPCGVQADEQDCQDAIAFIQPDRVLTVNIKGRGTRQRTGIAGSRH